MTTNGLESFWALLKRAHKAAFAQATVQSCIVHLIRRSLAYASYKERRALAAALKTIHRAPTQAAGEAALDAFEAGPWGEKYPAVTRSWRGAWEHVVPFFAFSEPIRRAIYTTNAIESLNSTVRRAVRTRGHFPNDRAATKLLYLALRGVYENGEHLRLTGTRCVRSWRSVSANGSWCRRERRWRPGAGYANRRGLACGADPRRGHPSASGAR